MKNIYASDSRASHVSLKLCLYRYELPAGQSIATYCSDLQDIAGQLNAISSTLLSLVEIVDIMIYSLPSSFSHIASTLATKDNSLTPSDVQAILIEAEKHLILSGIQPPPSQGTLSDPSSVALYAGKKKASSSAPAASSSQLDCYFCGKAHHMKDCPFTPRNRRSSNEVTAFTVEHALHARVDDDDDSDSFSQCSM